MHSIPRVLTVLLFVTGVAQAEPPNTLTLDNRSGEDALVKVVGPTRAAVEVPTGSSRTLHVAAGGYVLLVRYGREAGQYTYTKGDPFAVRQTPTEYSVITITLHRVVNGNYGSVPIAAGEFDRGSQGW
jgi:hypothetical protein